MTSTSIPQGRRSQIVCSCGLHQAKSCRSGRKPQPLGSSCSKRGGVGFSAALFSFAACYGCCAESRARGELTPVRRQEITRDPISLRFGGRVRVVPGTIHRQEGNYQNFHFPFHLRTFCTALHPSTAPHQHQHPPPRSPYSSAIMALDSFFHNKIESMKLEIIQGQAVLRRLEAQRNDYNSRGSITIFPSQLLGLIPSSTAAQGRAGVAATTWILRW